MWALYKRIGDMFWGLNFFFWIWLSYSGKLETCFEINSFNPENKATSTRTHVTFLSAVITANFLHTDPQLQQLDRFSVNTEWNRAFGLIRHIFTPVFINLSLEYDPNFTNVFRSYVPLLPKSSKNEGKKTSSKFHFAIFGETKITTGKYCSSAVI